MTLDDELSYFGFGIMKLKLLDLTLNHPFVRIALFTDSGRFPILSTLMSPGNSIFA